MRQLKIFYLLLTFFVLTIFSSTTFSQNKDTTSNDEFKDWTENTDEFKEFNDNETNDEFKEWDDNQTDEFKEFNDDESADEFKEFNENESDDEFKEFNDDENLTTGEKTSEKEGCEKNCQKNKDINTALKWVLISFFFTILAGFLVRNKSTRNLRGLFLVSSLVVYGFYKGACPCPIMSFQNVFLFFIGTDVHWTKFLWFLGLIPITYVFGKVWCGWICHLGALQEILFHPGKVKILQSEKAQKVMRFLRMFFLVALVVQIFITKSNLYKDIDPFKVAFNFYSSNLTGWILLGLLLVSSVFIYRPFCKTLCPIGLILGWVTKIPGASVVGIKGKCASCALCNGACKINAITRDEKQSVIENQECISCGECLDSCKQSGLAFVRKNKNHNDKVICKN